MAGVYPHLDLPLFPAILAPILGKETLTLSGLGTFTLSQISDLDRSVRLKKSRGLVADQISAKVQLMIRSRRIAERLGKIRVRVPASVSPSDIPMSDRALLFFQNNNFFDAAGKWRNVSLLYLAQIKKMGARYLIAYLVAVESMGKGVKDRAPAIGKSRFLEDELSAVVNETLYSPRANLFFMQAHGWDGKGVRTFERVGKSMNLTRERVRQLVTAVRETMEKSIPGANSVLIHRAVTTISDITPCTAEAAAQALMDHGISRAPFDPSGVHSAVEVFGLTCSWNIHEHNGLRQVMTEHQARLVENIQKIAGAMGLSRGLVSLQMLISEARKVMSLEVDQRLVRFSAETMEGVSWLDAAEGSKKPQWFWFPEKRSRNTALLKIRKLVSYAGTVSIHDVESALSRYGKKSPGAKHFDGMDAPEHILSEFCRQAGFKISGSKISTTKESKVAVPKVELRMANTLRAAGGKLPRSQFSKACLKRKIPAPTFAIYLMTSPLFVMDAGKNVSLRGVPPQAKGGEA